jgi:hypothetical protein
VFLGHFGVGFSAKRAAPRMSPGSLFLGAQFLDLLLGPPPATVVALAGVAHAQSLLVVWGDWIDRHRRPVA